MTVTQHTTEEFDSARVPALERMLPPSKASPGAAKREFFNDITCAKTAWNFSKLMAHLKCSVLVIHFGFFFFFSPLKVISKPNKVLVETEGYKWLFYVTCKLTLKALPGELQKCFELKQNWN